MAHYLIGDIQGCGLEFKLLLEEIGFSPSRDTIYPLGDLVNRGGASAEVLRLLMSLEGSAKCVLGNHDISLLALSVGIISARPRDTMQSLLAEKDFPQMRDWLRQQPLARFENNLLMVHAGVLPQWDIADVLHWSDKIGKNLRKKKLGSLLPKLWGNLEQPWREELSKREKKALALNALTRLRYCTPDGIINYTHKSGGINDAPEGFSPWFNIPRRKTRDITIAFGHWSTLGLVNTQYLMALDTACVWGGALTAIRFDPKHPGKLSSREVIQIKVQPSTSFMEL